MMCISCGITVDSLFGRMGCSWERLCAFLWVTRGIHNTPCADVGYAAGYTRRCQQITHSLTRVRVLRKLLYQNRLRRVMPEFCTYPRSL